MKNKGVSCLSPFFKQNFFFDFFLVNFDNQWLIKSQSKFEYSPITTNK